MEANYVKMMFGEHAVHVPAWVVIQDQGDGLVSFVGGSKVEQPQHPLRYGAEHTHQLVIGEIVLRPHTVMSSDECTGAGLAGIATNPFPLLDGELIAGKPYTAGQGLSA